MAHRMPVCDLNPTGGRMVGDHRAQQKSLVKPSFLNTTQTDGQKSGEGRGLSFIWGPVTASPEAVT